MCIVSHKCPILLIDLIIDKHLTDCIIHPVRTTNINMIDPVFFLT